jgi:3-phenylpropionate/cinnamic acid dioxygenase small subunit
LSRDELKRALDRLVSRAAITESLHRYARLIDERNFDALSEIFANDCTAEYGSRDCDVLRSSDEVIDWIKTQLRQVRATSHHISNVEIDFIDAHHAASVCYVYAWHDIDGMTAKAVVLGRYVDRFERTGQQWRITHRQLFAHGFEHFPADFIRPLLTADDKRP